MTKLFDKYFENFAINKFNLLKWGPRRKFPDIAQDHSDFQCDRGHEKQDLETSATTSSALFLYLFFSTSNPTHSWFTLGS